MNIPGDELAGFSAVVTGGAQGIGEANAGVIRGKPLLGMRLADWQQVITPISPAPFC